MEISLYVNETCTEGIWFSCLVVITENKVAIKVIFIAYLKDILFKLKHNLAIYKSSKLLQLFFKCFQTENFTCVERDLMTFSAQFSSVAQSCPTLCDPMNCSMPGLPVHHQLPEFTQTHVHQVGDAIQPSHPLSSPSPPAPNPSQHQGLSQ